MARQGVIQIRLTHEIKKQLEDFAGEIGMTTANLGSFIIGQWIRQQNLIIGPFVKELQDGCLEIAKRESEADDK